DAALVTRVESPEGEPVGGVAVELRIGFLFADPRPCSLGITDADGRCVLPHAQTMLRAQETACGPATSMVLGATIPGLPPPRLPLAGVAVDLRHPPREAVVLAVPHTGSIGVEVTGPDGEPGGASVLLTDVERPHQQARPEVLDGRGLVRHVALGRTF